MIDLSNIVTLSSSDITNILLQFFSIGLVLPVLAAVIALALVPKIVRALRWAVMAPGSSGVPIGVIDESNDPRWLTVPSDLPDWNMEYEVATGSGFEWRASTDAEQAALDPGLPDIYRGRDPDDFDYIQFETEIPYVARAVESSEASRDRYDENTRAQDGPF